MNGVDEAIAAMALELHPDRLMSVAAELDRSGCVNARDALTRAGAGLPGNLLSGVQQALLMEAIPGSDLAAKLRTAATVAKLMRDRTAIDLVWTGPSSGLIPVRHTEQVLTGLIDAARERLFLVSFVAHDVPSIVDALHRAARRGVAIRLLLERSADAGGKVSVDSVSTLRTRIPGAFFYEWDQAVSGGEFTGACVHAKCAVADGAQAFVTSANLTTSAMEKNMEAGVVIRGGHLPAQLELHLNALISTKHLKPL
jgi:phosphatidylserine/phosphatidylglycerophosphate/cardiolipin synthase-like enzyme